MGHPDVFSDRDHHDNTNGLIRQYFSTCCDFATVTEDDFNRVQDKLNNRPRKVLNLMMPNALLFGIFPNVALGYVIQVG